jgi:hypothetical protein
MDNIKEKQKHYIIYDFVYSKRSDTPNLDALQLPMTESEWRKTTVTQATAGNMAKKVPTSDSVPLNSNTTVNPRERPKAHITYTNPIIPLVSTASGSGVLNPQGGGVPRLSGQATTSNKLSLSIKPLVSTTTTSSATTTTQMTTPLTPTAAAIAANKPQEQLCGFEDDFSSLNTMSSHHHQQPTVQIRQPPQQHQNTPSGDSSLFNQQQYLLLFQPPAGMMMSDKNRTHRRSASHTSSSSAVMFSESSPTTLMSLDSGTAAAAASVATIDLINMNTNVAVLASPEQLLQQQLQYQHQMLQQQQQMQQYQLQQQQHQQHQQLIHPTNSLSVQTNNRLIAHSRSASASPK